ncbi:MAG: site-specific integrase [Plectolyngbya sp. WJT66-NPBG17]|nr:site-specific integrase [Plectolyngbya sp. WJT66-NPBG17]
MAKQNGHGQAKILSDAEISKLFSEGFQTDRDRALFAIALFTGCRISEACSMLTDDVYDDRGNVLDTITIRKANTKGKIGTRQMDIVPALKAVLQKWASNKDALFPGRHGLGSIRPVSADHILRDALKRIGIEGASTHSFRRTALTKMNNAGIPLSVIQRISGHKSLTELQRYLEVTEEDKSKAIAHLNWSL